jgi:PilZ domain
MTMTIAQRSERVSFPIRIEYRRPGDVDWRSSTVVNLSDSGVLFGAPELEPGTFVELALSPPIRVGWLAPGKQVCAGEVVRADGGAVAVRLGEYRFSL